MTSHDQFDHLADRLRKMTIENTASSEMIEQIMAMPLEDLRKYPIDFGRAHLGKLYGEMVKDTKYLAWFAETYKHSQKISHIRFLRFIELYLNEIEGQFHHTQPKSRAKAKAKATSKGQTSELKVNLPHDPWHPSSDEDVEAMSSTWEPVRASPEIEEEMTMMRDRMGEMENMMKQVLSLLSPNVPAPSH